MNCKDVSKLPGNFWHRKKTGMTSSRVHKFIDFCYLSVDSFFFGTKSVRFQYF
jgi:hypothetical protein